MKIPCVARQHTKPGSRDHGLNRGGDAIVKVQASGDGGPASLELHTGDSSRASATYGAVRVTLVELQPYPFSSRPVAPGDYRATLLVGKR